jgi:glycosyltransferase involved in cell wall biosynthesis
MQRNAPQITTIIPTYRRPELLRKAVQSVLDQTYKNFQVCVYDNSSGDETEKIMLEFAKNDSRVQYHRHTQNIGMIKNYEFGFNRINTSYFSFLSDDDKLDPWFFDTALQAFAQFPEAAIAICAVKLLQENGEVIASTLLPWSREGLFEVPDGFLEMLSAADRLPIPTCTLFSKKKIKGICPSWTSEMELRWDSEYILRIASQYPIFITKKPCGFFLLHSSSYSTIHYQQMHLTSKALDAQLKTSKAMINNILANPDFSVDFKRNARQLFNRTTRHDMYHFFFIYIKKRRFIEALFSIKFIHNYFGIDYHFFRLIWNKTLNAFPPRLSSIIRMAACPLKFIVKILVKGKKSF